MFDVNLSGTVSGFNIELSGGGPATSWGKVKIGGVLVDVLAPKIKIGGVLVDATGYKVKVGGVLVDVL